MWNLEIGATLDRSAIHKDFDGRKRSRISPSGSSPNVFLFLTPGMEGSSFDGWTGQGHVHFGGEGGTDGSDQQFKGSNRSVRDHAAEGRELRLFHGTGAGQARYTGRYQLDPDVPYFRADAPTDIRHPHDLRSTIVFRLQPLDGPPEGLPLTAPLAATQQIVRTEPGFGRDFLGLRVEAARNERATDALLDRYTMHLRTEHSANTAGYRITVPGSISVMHVELLNLSANELVVTSSSTARSVIRRMLGQLDDLARFFNPTPRRVLLLPAAPERDLAELLASRNITATWPSPTGFDRTHRGS